MSLKSFLFFLSLFLIIKTGASQEMQTWHNKPRQIHYKPSGKSFILQNGTRKFNRALYGTNTGFRVEAGDLPEFAMYMPGMGGNFQLGILSGEKSKWITEADSIAATYTPGIMEYEIRDHFFGNGVISLQIAALADAEGFILKLDAVDIPKEVSLVWVYGGASGKKFHRDGDIGADPESVFYLQPQYCRNNTFRLKPNSFLLDYGWDDKTQTTTRNMSGAFPSSEVHLASALHRQNPLNLLNSKADSLPVLVGKMKTIDQKSYYWEIKNSAEAESNSQQELARDFKKAMDKAEEISSRIKVNTPDPYINTLGGALAIAGDAIWESPAFLHGSVAWRMHLNAWRGAYVADPLGWHDRAKKHFQSYGKSQVLEPASGPVVPDTLRNFARQEEKIGTAMFSNGYICRHPENNSVAHHYDMNLVFIDQLLNHFQWSGDREFIKEMWPVIKRHLAWEKRNFDADRDGLYDAYAAIWASDALQYSGGGVTYTSAYNYRANKMAAQIAEMLGENPKAYHEEAAKIYAAVQEELWLPEKGVFAEYKDLLGNQLLHKNPGIWTIYHAIDEGVANRQQASQMLHYIDTEIPHIPVKAEGLEKEGLYLLSTTNWQPYTWSVNNVALAENLHTALAYWQGGQPDKAYKLWESALVESMYLGASPGGFQQLSFYDAMRGELYRDFADPVGMTARTLVEGLFGIQPDAINNTLTVKPGFPAGWGNASLTVPDVLFSYKKKGNIEVYEIVPRFSTKMDLQLELPAYTEAVKSVKINGDEVDWSMDESAVGAANIIINNPYSSLYKVEITWNGSEIEKIKPKKDFYRGEKLDLTTSEARILAINDPQQVLNEVNINNKEFEAVIDSELGNKSFFLKLQQGEMSWWQPVNIEVRPKVEITSDQVENDQILLQISNISEEIIEGELIFGLEKANKGENISLKANETTSVAISTENLMPGTNKIQISTGKEEAAEVNFQNWDIRTPKNVNYRPIDLTSAFNAQVSEIFKQEYMNPRPVSPSLQLPITGIGNWCYPTVTAEIDDSGLREIAGRDGEFLSPQGVPFKTPSEENEENIAFVSQWENFPKELTIPLEGKASHAYFIIAGSTNPMQSRLLNGEVVVTYTDGSEEILELKNPENWWPIEQDYFTDGYAFTTGADKPPRLYFKSGEITRNFKDFEPIKGFTEFGINGGAGTILDLPLDPGKKLKKLSIRAVANEVVIGLMSVTLANSSYN